MPSPLGPRHRIFSFIILQSIRLSIWSLKLFPIRHCGSSTLVPTSPFVGSCISLHPLIPGCICRDFESHPSSPRMWAIRPLCWSPNVETIKVRTQPLSFSTYMAVHAFEGSCEPFIIDCPTSGAQSNFSVSFVASDQKSYQAFLHLWV